MAVTYVGGQGAGFAGTTSAQTITFSLTNGLASTPAAGDLVIITYFIGSTVARSQAIRNTSTVDYSLMADLTQSDTFDANQRSAYRFMPSTPETQFVLTETVGGGTGSTSDAGRYTVHVFRGVDTNTPMDVAVVTAGAVSSSAVDPPSITPTTTGAMIYIAGGAASGTGSTMTAAYLTDFRAGSTADTNDASIGAGYLAWDNVNPYNGAAYGNIPTGTTANSWTCIAAALRPAGGNFDQDSFRGKDDGTEATENWITTANTNWNQYMDINFRIRFLIEELDDFEDFNVQFQLQYNRNAAGWNDVNASSSYARSSAGSVTDGENTTEQLDGPGTYISTNAGVDEVNGLAGGAALDFTTTANQEVELEYTLQLRSAELAKGDTVDFRLVKEPDIPLGSYTNSPTVTPIFDNLVQAAFRGRYDLVGEAAPPTGDDWKDSINTNWIQTMDENFRIRFLIQETNNLARANFGAQLQYNLNGGGWNNVNAASSIARSSASSVVADGADTTANLLGSGTYITNNDGFDDVDGLSGGANLDFTGNDEVEVEYSLQLRSADLSEGDTVQFRIAGLDAYNQTPTVTPKFPTHFVMVTSTNIEENQPTTQQLTAQSGTFVSGTISESTPEADPPITIVSRGYTEYEFCIEASLNAVAGAQYEFRLVDEDQAGEKLEVYTVVPKVTLAP